MGVGNGGTWVGEIAKGHRETVDSLRSMTGVLRSLTDSIGADVARGRENLIPGGRKYTKDTDPLLDMIDVLVDGPFVEELKDITLKFRGSSNQRLLDLKKTREILMP